MIRQVVFALLLLIGMAGATCTTGSSGTCEVGSGKTYTTIQTCATAATAGDTCTVYAGNYAEIVTLPNAGTGSNGVCSACITFQVNPGDTVTVQQFYSTAASYVIIQGFIVTEPTLSLGNEGIHLENSTGAQILNNTITQVGHVGASGYDCINLKTSHYGTIKGNKISWCSAVSGAVDGNPHMQSAIAVSGDHFLIQNNDLSHVTNGIQVGGSATYVAIIGNNYHDCYVGADPLVDINASPPPSDAPSCVEGVGCDSHLDYMEATGGGNHHILMDNNTASNIWGTGGAHGWFMSEASAGDTDVISRFSTMYKMGSGYLGNNAGSAGVTYWKDYNNSFIISNQQVTSGAPPYTDGGWAGCANSGTNGSFLNDLMYNDVQPSGTSSAGYYLWDSTCTAGFNSGYNLAFDSACTAATLSTCTTGQMQTGTGNIFADPKLWATDGSSFNLQSGSPALNTGTKLTTVAAGDSGSGTSLIVNDATYFQDGYGIPGVTADCISVTTAANHVCITAVNYSTNTLTLASGFTRASGDSVWLYSDSTGRIVLQGGAPNIGAGFLSGTSHAWASPASLTWGAGVWAGGHSWANPSTLVWN